MRIKYRYYLKEGGEVKTIDYEDGIPDQFAQKDVPKLTLAMLSAGIEESAFENARKFFVDQGFLIRAPIFIDEKGAEHQGQNEEYCFVKRGIFKYYGVRPSQGAQILHDAIIDGFDVYTNGGLGFAQNNPAFFAGIEAEPEKFIGKFKPRIYGFSNVSNATILQDFFDYIHCPGLTQLLWYKKRGLESADQVLSIIREQDVALSRQAIAINQQARDLVGSCEADDLQVRSYPINISTFFFNNYNSDFAYIAPKEDYSLMLESIAWHDVKAIEKSLSGLRKFLHRLQQNGQVLPKMIEAGNFTESSVTGSELMFEDGRIKLSPDHARKFTQEQYHSLQKKHDEVTKTYNLGLENLCNEFGIAFFVGGDKRIGHALDNQVQPSNSICKVQKDGYFLKIDSTINARRQIEAADIKGIEQKRTLPKLKTSEASLIVVESSSKLPLKLQQMSGDELDLAAVKSANFVLSESAASDLRDADARAMSCVVVPRRMLTNIFTKSLEPELLSGKMHLDESPLVLAISANLQKATEKELAQIQKDAEKMIAQFAQEHKISRPVFLARNFVDIVNDKDLVPLKDGGIVKYQTEIEMLRAHDTGPNSSTKVEGSARRVMVEDNTQSI